MIGDIKNIRFTYQWAAPKFSLSRKRVRIPAGSAATRRPIRAPPGRGQQERAMPAITAVAISTAVRARRSLKRMIDRVKNRRETMRLASLDDRMLADIGL